MRSSLVVKLKNQAWAASEVAAQPLERRHGQGGRLGHETTHLFRREERVWPVRGQVVGARCPSSKRGDQLKWELLLLFDLVSVRLNSGNGCAVYLLPFKVYFRQESLNLAGVGLLLKLAEVQRTTQLSTVASRSSSLPGPRRPPWVNS